jgi:hypothetical protein
MNDPSSSNKQSGMVPGSRVERLATMEESRIVVNRIIAGARRSLHIFERDLGDAGYHDPRRIELMEQFLRRGQGNRMLVVVHDTRYIERDAARFISLYRRYTHAMEIHQTLDTAKVATDSLVLADESSYWHRLNHDLAHAVVGYNDSAGAGPLEQRFAEIWEASEIAALATTLGL